MNRKNPVAMATAPARAIASATAALTLTLNVTATLVFAFGSAGCGRPSDFLYVHPESPKVEAQVKIKELVGTNQLDILWVIDNSGSMSSHQQNVIANMDRFITSLTAKSSLDWRSGLISTSVDDEPFGGFKSGDMLEYSDPGVAAKFKAAVAKLGTNGDATEKTFEPVMKALTNYPRFLRPSAALALIVISDAPEQSKIDVGAFVQFLQRAKGNLSSIYFYGFLNPSDWCTSTDEAFTWAGNPFEILNKQLKGQIYKLCDPNFSNNLSDLGKNLGQELSSFRIYLKDIPRIGTIRVTYNGQPLMGGPKDKGGFWTYRIDINAIEFSDLSFAPGVNESVKVNFDVDNGLN